MRLCIFSCVISKYPQETELDDIVRIMRTSDKLRALCEEYRNISGKGKKREKRRFKLKKIPAFVPSALVFEGKGHRHVIGLTNLCYMDIDHLQAEQIDEAMDTLRQDEHVVLALRSMSGNGIHFMVKYGFKDMEQPQITTMSAKKMVKTYISVFKTISSHYQDILHLPIDESGQNVVQLCNISYDEDLYYNPHALPYTLKFEKTNNFSQQLLKLEI